METDEQLPCDVGQGEAFRTTHWSVVLLAGETQSPDSMAALEKLCRAYWHPIYAFVRRSGYDAATAQDLTQEFFCRMLAKDFLRSVNQEKGNFRSFLLASMKHFLANEWDRAHRQKRGGGAVIFSLDQETAEDRYFPEPADDSTPEKAYDRRWASRPWKTSTSAARP
jgi:RNA polymerase sigma-70 factor (ECF subfamily)